MPKRFIDTEIWEQDWFIRLPNKYKLLWLYIVAKCDSAGIWRPNIETINRITSSRFKLDEFISVINKDKIQENERDRILVLPNGRWFVQSFFVFQYGKSFSIDSPVHRGALSKLIECDIDVLSILPDPLGKLQGLTNQQLKEIGLGKPINSPKDKDIVSNKGGLEGGIKRVHRKRPIEDSIQDTREEKKDDSEAEEIEFTETQENAPPEPEEPDRSFNPNIGPDGKFRFITDPVPTARPKQFNTALVFRWDNQKFREQWEHWKDYLWDWRDKGGAGGNGLHYPYRGLHAEQAALENIFEMAAASEDMAYRILNYTISNGWKTFQRPKKDNDGKSKSTSGGRSDTDQYAEHKRNMAERIRQAGG